MSDRIGGVSLSWGATVVARTLRQPTIEQFATALRDELLDLPGLDIRITEGGRRLDVAPAGVDDRQGLSVVAVADNPDDRHILLMEAYEGVDGDPAWITVDRDIDEKRLGDERSLNYSVSHIVEYVADMQREVGIEQPHFPTWAWSILVTILGDATPDPVRLLEAVHNAVMGVPELKVEDHEFPEVLGIAPVGDNSAGLKLQLTPGPGEVRGRFWWGRPSEQWLIEVWRLDDPGRTLAGLAPMFSALQNMIVEGGGTGE